MWNDSRVEFLKSRFNKLKTPRRVLVLECIVSLLLPATRS